jgi:outer membrane receptor protein involved in Fe transport
MRRAFFFMIYLTGSMAALLPLVHADQPVGRKVAVPKGESRGARTPSVPPGELHPVEETPDEPGPEIQPVQLAQPAIPAQPAQPAQPTELASAQTLSSDIGTSLNIPGGLFGTTGGSSPSSVSRQQQTVATQPSANVVTGVEVLPRVSTDVGDLLGKTESVTGVSVQQRNPIINDPRPRGYHVGQVLTWMDGAFFFPARQDLDTAVSKIDSRVVRDVIVVKGPYLSHLGPGFAFFDVATRETPRYRGGVEAHGRTSVTYQTNGDRWDGWQTLWGGGADWGYRASYGILAGSDYSAGNGQRVPSSYNSQDFDLALGVDLSPDSHLEFRGMRLHQHDLQLAGQAFDLNRLDTDAYTLRYVLEKQAYFDRLTFDLWYNRTAADGDTGRFPKKVVYRTLFEGLNDILSTTEFSLMARGYRLAVDWGEAGCPQLTVGTDLTYYVQRLREDVVFTDVFHPLPTPFVSTVGIPRGTSNDPGLFLESVVPLGKQLKVKSGGRVDWVRTNSADRTRFSNDPRFNGTNFVDPMVSNTSLPNYNPTSVRPTDTNRERHFDLWSAYITAEYQLIDHVTALSGFGYAQRPPTVTELYGNTPFIATLQQGFNRLIGDPHLKNEELKQLDVGLKADFERFRGGINGFYSWIDNYITYDTFAGPKSNAQSLEAIFTNTDWATLAGGEVYAEVDANRWLTPFGTLSYVEGRDQTHVDRRHPAMLCQPTAADFCAPTSRRPGAAAKEPLPGIPPLEARVGLRIHEPGRNPRWGVEFTARIVDEQDRIAESVGEVRTPGFTIYDLRTYWQATRSLLLTAGVENFGNKLYRESIDPRAGDQFFRPGTNFYFGAQLQY